MQFALKLTGLFNICGGTCHFCVLGKKIANPTHNFVDGSRHVCVMSKTPIAIRGVSIFVVPLFCFLLLPYKLSFSIDACGVFIDD